jgi:hypothetical protein
MLPNDEGKYVARPKRWAVGESKEGAVQFAVDFSLSQYFSDAAGEWHDISSEGYSIVGYFYPISKAGNLVEMTVESLQESLGWSGASLTELNDSDWSQTEVQLVLQREEYQGRTQMKVKFINPRDYAGGNGIKADAAEVKTLDQRFGAILRANPKAKKPQAPQAGNGQQVTEAEKERRLAYNKLKEKVGANLSKEAFAEVWRGAASDYFKKPQEHVGAAEWRKFVADGFAKPMPENPISDTRVFTEAEIPY